MEPNTKAAGHCKYASALWAMCRNARQLRQTEGPTKRIIFAFSYQDSGSDTREEMLPRGT